MDDAQAEDEKVRKKIGWLNKNGFEGGIHYQKIIEAAKGLEYSEVMFLLKQLEAKPRGTIKDPTGWVCTALKKAGGGGGGMPPAYGFGGMGGGAPPAFGGGGGFPPPLDADTDQKLRRRIGWLNKDGGFENAINYQKVAEAAAGVDPSQIMEILKELEEKKDQVKDPTAYTSAALRKRRGGAGGMPPPKRARM